MTIVRETATADCPFSAAIEYAATFFAQKTILPLSATLALRSNVATTYAIVLDTTDVSRMHDALHVDWKPIARLPLPRFSG